MFAHRRSRDPLDYAASLLRATNTEVPARRRRVPAAGHQRQLGRARDGRGLPRGAGDADRDAAPRSTTRWRARARRGSSALKTIAAYRGGLDRRRATRCSSRWRPTPRPAIRCRCRSTPASATPTSRCRSSRPGLLKPLIERFDTTPFVLLHCYPFVREAGWLAHVYANVFFDLSLTIPHVAQPEQALREALELAPLSKLLYASDAARTPELYFLGATWWRDALAVVLRGAGGGRGGGADDPARERARALPAERVGREVMRCRAPAHGPAEAGSAPRRRRRARPPR